MNQQARASAERVLVTGASSGFGYLTSLRLAAEGYVVFAGMRALGGRNRAASESLLASSAEARGVIVPVSLDVTEDASVASCLTRVTQEGGLDAVVHNAGVAAAGLVETFSADVARQIFEVNVFGPLRVQRACLPLLRKSRSPRVVYLSSTDGREVMPFLGLYNASKAALESLAEGWSYELNALGIRSVIVQPGTFPTTSILKNLLPPDAPERAEAYGRLAAAPGALFASIATMVEEGRAPAPSLVIDAVVRALSPDAPPRIVVDPSGFDGTQRINAVCADVQRALLERCELSHLGAVATTGQQTNGPSLERESA